MNGDGRCWWMPELGERVVVDRAQAPVVVTALNWTHRDSRGVGTNGFCTMTPGRSFMDAGMWWPSDPRGVQTEWEPAR